MRPQKIPGKAAPTWSLKMLNRIRVFPQNLALGMKTHITQPGDSVTVTKMVSLSRNFAEYCRVKEAFRAKGVKIHSLETLLDPALMGSLLIENYGSIYNAIATQYLENKLNYRKKNKMTGDNKKEDV